jgi:hypothetical protein
MTPEDDLFKVLLPQDFQMSPHPTHFLTRDSKVYNAMMTAVYTYLKARAEAEKTMYEKMLTIMNPPRRGK